MGEGVSRATALFASACVAHLSFFSSKSKYYGKQKKNLGIRPWYK